MFGAMCVFNIVFGSQGLWLVFGWGGGFGRVGGGGGVQLALYCKPKLSNLGIVV